MAEVGSAFVTIAPSAKGFGRQMESQVGGEVQKSGGKIGKAFGTALKGGALAGGILLGGFLKGSLDEAREAQKVGAQTNAVIKSTGGVAKVTAKDIGTLSTAISNKAGIDDEAIATGANLLLTFTNIRNEAGKGNKVFDQTTLAATDMAVALGTDVKSAAMQLGKALNDPTKGVTKLQRSGVTFTDQQKEQIKTLQASGKTLQAQKIILGEVNKEFGGSAAAAATAGDKFKVAFGNLQESVGTAILPIVDKILNGLTKLAIFLTNNIGPGMVALNGYLAPVIATVGKLFSAGGQASPLVTSLASIGATIRSNFLPVLALAANTLTTIVVPALSRLGSYLVANLLPIFRQVGSIIATQVVPIIATLARFMYGVLYPAIARVVIAIAGQLKPVFDQLFRTIQTSVLPTVNLLLGKFRQFLPTLLRVGAIVLKVVSFLLVLAAAILGKVLPVVIRLAGLLIRLLARALVVVVTGIARAISFLIRLGAVFVSQAKMAGRFAVAVGQAVGKAVGFIKSLPGKAKSALGNLGGLLVHAGAELVDGLIRGITSKIGALASKMHELASKVKGFLPGSPVKEGPLTSWNNGGAGKRLVGLLADGLGDTGAVDSAMGRLSSRVAVGAPQMSTSITSGIGAGVSGGSRHALTITNWQTGEGYMSTIADRSINGTRAHDARLGRQSR